MLKDPRDGGECIAKDEISEKPSYMCDELKCQEAYFCRIKEQKALLQWN